MAADSGPDVFEPSHIAAIRAVGGPARVAYALRAWGAAVEVVGRLERGGSVFAVSASQFSALDVLVAVLRKIGPADLDMWTYTPGEAEVEALAGLVGEKAVRRLRLIIDQSGLHTRHEAHYRRIQERFGRDAIRVTKAHAKLMALSTEDGWRVVIDGSANLAKNLRFEQVNIRDDAAVWSLVAGLTDDVFGAAAPLDLEKVSGAAARAVVTRVAAADGGKQSVARKSKIVWSSRAGGRQSSWK